MASKWPKWAGSKSHPSRACHPQETISSCLGKHIRRTIPNLCYRPAVKALSLLETEFDPQDLKATDRLIPQSPMDLSSVLLNFLTILASDLPILGSFHFPEILNVFGLQVFSCLGSKWKANMGKTKLAKSMAFLSTGSRWELGPGLIARWASSRSGLLPGVCHLAVILAAGQGMFWAGIFCLYTSLPVN